MFSDLPMSTGLSKFRIWGSYSKSLQSSPFLCVWDDKKYNFFQSSQKNDIKPQAGITLLET